VTKQILFVDFDSTLFNTKDYMLSTWQAVAAHYGLDVAHEMARVPEFYRQIGDLRTYYFDDHIHDVLPGEPLDNIARVAYEALKDRDFLYSDAQEIFTWRTLGCEVRILTFAEPWTQHLKFNLVPAFDEFPRDIVLEEKGQFIARTFPGVRGWLVDDRINNGLPEGVKGVWLNRAGLPNTSRNDIITINSLTQVQEVL
jgi:hypothetical protein